MPFIKIDIEKQIEEKRQTDPKFKKTWDESRAEYKLIGEMISSKKKRKTQNN